MSNRFTGFIIAMLFTAGFFGSVLIYGGNAFAIRCPDGSFLPDERASECPPANSDGDNAGPDRRTVVDPRDCEFDTDSILGIPLWYKYLEGKKDVIIYEGNETNASTAACVPVIEEPADGLPIGLAVLEMAMTLAGMVAVVMIFWGSFNFVLTQGESDKAASARKTVINAAIGLAIIIVATRVVSFIANTITG